jgi:hypothetical protein
MYTRSEQCLVSSSFFATPPPPPKCCAAESQPVRNIRDEERFGGGKGVGLVIKKSIAVNVALCCGFYPAKSLNVASSRFLNGPGTKS